MASFAPRGVHIQTNKPLRIISKLKIFSSIPKKERERAKFSIDKRQEKAKNTEYRGSGTSVPFWKKYRRYRYRY